MSLELDRESHTPLIVVSNRLPFVLKRDADLRLKRCHSAGGLVTAVAPVVIKCSGKWIGWPGIFDLGEQESIPEADKDDRSPTAGLKSNQVVPVNIPADDFDGFYNGFCNATLWPLFHSFSFKVTYNNDTWKTYKKVNDVFAEKTVEALRLQSEETSAFDDVPIIWIHDYQLLLCPAKIRQAAEDEGLRCKLGFFLHIPFPSYDMLHTLGGSEEILQGMLACDVVGFHIDIYSNNFLEACLRMLGCRVNFEKMTIEIGSRIVRVRTLPIGIPFDKFEECAKKAPSVRSENKDTKLVISVDRVDYTKGLVQKLKGIERLLEKYPQFYAGKLTFLQIGVPSRTDIKDYQCLHDTMSREVGRINGKFSTADWQPIRFIFKGLPQDELSAYYRDSDVALITPLMDGMNLVAKEYVACQINRSGVLVLSPFAGAAESMKEAVFANPYEISLLADSLHRALQMPLEERRKRMDFLRERERRSDVHFWMSSFLEEMKLVNPSEEPTLPNVSLDVYTKTLTTHLGISSKLSVILSYDGTLAPAAPTPQEAVLPEETRKILTSLSSMKDISVCVISGRSVADLRKMVNVKGITYAGSNGLEIVHTDGNFFVHPVPEDHQEKIHKLTQSLHAEACRYGAWVENKGPLATFHYRNVPKKYRATICAQAVKIFADHGFQIHNMPMAYEARPTVNWDITRAATYFLRSTYGVDWSQRCTVIYVGDIEDDTVMSNMKSFAFTISVSKPSNLSRGFKRLPDARGVLGLLRWLEQKMLERPQKPAYPVPELLNCDPYLTLSAQMSIVFDHESEPDSPERQRRRSRTCSLPGKVPICLGQKVTNGHKLDSPEALMTAPAAV